MNAEEICRDVHEALQPKQEELNVRRAKANQNQRQRPSWGLEAPRLGQLVPLSILVNVSCHGVALAEGSRNQEGLAGDRQGHSPLEGIESFLEEDVLRDKIILRDPTELHGGGSHTLYPSLQTSGLAAVPVNAQQDSGPSFHPTQACHLSAGVPFLWADRNGKHRLLYNTAGGSVYRVPQLIDLSKLFIFSASANPTSDLVFNRINRLAQLGHAPLGQQGAHRQESPGTYHPRACSPPPRSCHAPEELLGIASGQMPGPGPSAGCQCPAVGAEPLSSGFNLNSMSVQGILQRRPGKALGWGRGVHLGDELCPQLGASLSAAQADLCDRRDIDGSHSMRLRACPLLIQSPSPAD